MGKSWKNYRKTIRKPEENDVTMGNHVVNVYITMGNHQFQWEKLWKIIIFNGKSMEIFY